MNQRTREVTVYIFKTIFRRIFYGNIFISICALCMTLETYLILGIPVTYHSTFPLLFIVFFSTFFIYNIDLFASHHIPEEIVSSDRSEWRIKHKSVIKTINIFAGILIFLFSLFTTFESFLFFAHLAVISLAYYFSFEVGSAKFVPLRKIPLLKAFVISYVWAGSSVFLPALKNSVSIASIQVVQLFIERYFFLFALAIMFDIRDLSYDHKNIRTIPGVLGSYKTKILSFTLLLAAGVMVCFHYQDSYLTAAFLSSFLASAFFIYRAKPESGEYYFLLLMDGAMILQFVLVLLSLNIF